jgi:maltose alpha-D-glucosyltransferase / alpha-amylase
MERLIRRRRDSPEFGWGRWRLIETVERSVLAHRCDWQGRTVIAVHNFSPEPCKPVITLDDPETCEGFFDLLGDRTYQPVDGSGQRVELAGYGHRWFRIRRTGQRMQP